MIVIMNPLAKVTGRKEAQPADPADESPAPRLDIYPIAIGMLTQTWNSQYDQSHQQFIKMFGNQTEDMMKQMREAFDKERRHECKQT